MPPTALKPTLNNTKKTARLIRETGYATTTFKAKGAGLDVLTGDIVHEIAKWTQTHDVVCCEIAWSAPACYPTELTDDAQRAISSILEHARSRLCANLGIIQNLPSESELVRASRIDHDLWLYRYCCSELMDMTHKETANVHSKHWFFAPGHSTWERLLSHYSQSSTRNTTVVVVNLVCLNLPTNQRLNDEEKDSTPTTELADNSLPRLRHPEVSSKPPISTSSTLDDLSIDVDLPKQLQRSVDSLLAGESQGTSPSMMRSQSRHSRVGISPSCDSGVGSIGRKDTEALLDSEQCLGVLSLEKRCKSIDDLQFADRKPSPQPQRQLMCLSARPTAVVQRTVKQVAVSNKFKSLVHETKFVTVVFEVRNSGLEKLSTELVEEFNRWIGSGYVVCCELAWSTPMRLRKLAVEHNLRSKMLRALVPVKWQLCRKIRLNPIPVSLTEEGMKNNMDRHWMGLFRYYTLDLLHLAHSEAAQEHQQFWSFDKQLRSPFDAIPAPPEKLDLYSMCAMNFVTLQLK